MNYQKKLKIIDDGRVSLESGTSWSDFQTRLISLPDLYQKDIDSIGVKVFSAINDTYGPKVLADLEATGSAVSIEGLHESFFNKILDQRTKQAKAKIRRTIQRQIQGGTEVSTVLAENAHPLLDDKIVQDISNAVLAREERKQENNVSSGSLFLGVFLLIMGLGLSFAVDTGRLFYGVILIGASIVIRFFVSLSD